MGVLGFGAGLGNGLGRTRHTGLAGGPRPDTSWVLIDASGSRAFADLDFENGRFYVNGVVHASIAAMVAAGVYNSTAGSTRLLVAPADGTFHVIVEATAAANNNAAESLIHGPGPSSSSINLRRNASGGAGGTANGIRAINIVSATTTTAGDDAVADGLRFSAVGQWKSSDYTTSVNGGAVKNTTTADRPKAVPTAIRIGNAGGVALWQGTIHRATIFEGEATDARLVQLSYQPLRVLDAVVGFGPVSGDYAYAGLADDANGDIKVGRINWKNLKYQKTNEKTLDTTPLGEDDHFIPARTIHNGRLVVLSAQHSDDILNFYASTDANPLHLGSALDLATALSMSNLTYTNMWSVGSRLIGMTQVADLAWQPFYTDDLENWTKAKRFFSATGGDPAQYYLGFSGSDTLAFGWADQHPGNAQNPFKLLTWNRETGEVRDSTGVKGTIYDATPDTALCNFANMDAIRTPTTGRSQSRLGTTVDADGKPRRLLRDYVNADGSDGSYYILMYVGPDPVANPEAVFDADNWTEKLITTSGAGNTAVFDQLDETRSTIYIVKENGSGTYTLEKWVTTDEWDTSAISGRAVATVSGGNEIVRVASTGLETMPVTWHVGVSTSFTDFELELRW